MNLVDVMRALVDDSVGTSGAVQNCRSELHRRQEVDRTVARLGCRVPGPGDARRRDIA